MRISDLSLYSIVHTSLFMQSETLTVINEDEKESNPVYKIICNKIRNLKKVLAQIAHIQTVEAKARKPAQVSKLNRKDEILAQIDKHEEFVVYYKKLVVEHDLVYDKTDDLIKISTFLTVGKRIEAEGYCPVQAKGVFENVYKEIFDKTCYNGKNQLSDEIVRVYHVLTHFMESSDLQLQCRDYMTYLPQFEVQKQKLIGEDHRVSNKVQKVVVVENKKSYKKQKIRQDDSDRKKAGKLNMTSEVVKITIDSNSTVDQLPSISSLTIDAFSTPAEIQEQQQELNLEKQQTGSTTNPGTEKDSIELELEIAEPVNQKDSVWTKKSEFGYDVDVSSTNGRLPQNNLPNSSNFCQNRRTRNRKNKKQHIEVEFNVRKCSDTSLEPTPEKPRGKRIRYIQKKD